MSLSKVSAAALVFVNAVLAVVYAIGDLELSDIEQAQLSLLASTTLALGLALYGHFRAAGSDEVVAVGAALIAWTESIFGALVVWSVFGITLDDAVLLQGVIIAGLALGGAIFVRSRVFAASTVENATAMARLDVHTPDPTQPS